MSRNTDICARWGGEEFAILCPETELEAALALASRFQDKLATLRSLIINKSPVALAYRRSLQVKMNQSGLPIQTKRYIRPKPKERTVFISILDNDFNCSVPNL